MPVGDNANNPFILESPSLPGIELPFSRFPAEERKRIQCIVNAIKSIQYPPFQEKLKILIACENETTFKKYFPDLLSKTRVELSERDMFSFYQLVSALFNIAPAVAAELTTYENCSLISENALQYILAGLKKSMMGEINVSSLPPEANIQLPTLTIKIMEGRILVQRSEANGIHKTLYDKIFTKDLYLEGFKDFDIWLNTEGVFAIRFNTTRYHLDINATIPLVIKEDLMIDGELFIQASNISNKAKICSFQNKIFICGMRFHHDEGIIQGKEGVSFIVKDLKLNAPVYSVQNISIWRGEVFECSNQLEAQGTLYVHWEEGGFVTQELTNNRGSLFHRLCSQAKKHLVFLANQIAEKDIEVWSPTEVSIGSELQAVSLFAKRGSISIEGRTVKLVHGQMIGNRGIKCQSETMLNLGKLEKPLGHTELISGGYIILEGRERVNWHQVKIKGNSYLDVKGAYLDNIASDCEIKGDAFIYTSWNKHRLLTEVKDLKGQRAPFCNSGAMKAFKTLGERRRAISTPASFRVGKKLKTTGQMEILGSTVHCGTFEGATPKVQDFIGYQEWIAHAYFGNPKRRTWWRHDPGRSIESSFIGKLSIAGHLESQEAILNITGIISSIGVKLIGIQEGNIGHTNLNRRLPSPRAFQNHISLLDYVTPSTLFRASLGGGESVFQSILPAFNEESQLGPILILRSGGYISANTENRRRLFCFEQEKEVLVKALLDSLCRGFLSSELIDPEKMLINLKQNAQRYLLDKGNQELVVHRGLNVIPEPLMVYKEIPFIHALGEEELVLVPLLYLPSSMDNPRLRDWAGGIFSLGEIMLEGASKDYSNLEITGYLNAENEIVIKTFNTLACERRTVKEIRMVVDTTRSKGIAGLGRKKTSVTKPVVDVYQESGCGIKGEGLLIEGVNNVRTQGAVIQTKQDGVRIKAVTIEQKMLITQRFTAVECQKRNFGSKMVSQIHIAAIERTPTIIQSKGQIVLQSRKGYYDDVLLDCPFSPQIDAQILLWNEGPKRLEAEQRLQESIQAEDRRTARRKRKQAIGKTVVITVISAGTSAWLSGYLVASEVLAAESLGLAIAKGAIASGTSALLRGQNIFKNAVEGVFFAALGYGLEEAFKGTFEWIENEALKGIFKESVKGSIVGGTQTLVHGGNIRENLIVGGISQGLAEALFPFSKMISNNKIYAISLQVGMRSMVASGAALLLTGSESLALNLVAAGLGGMAQHLGSHYGAQIALYQKLQKQQRWETKMLTSTNDAVENRSQSKNYFISAQGSKNEETHKNNKVSEEAILENILEMAAKKFSKLLNQHNISVSSRKIKNAFNNYSALQGSEQKITKNLIQLSRIGSNTHDSRNVFIREAEKVFSSVLTMLIKEAHASELNIKNDQEIKESHPRFALPSVLPKSDPNPFLDNAYAIGRAIEKARDGLTDIILHPIDNIKETAIFVWDISGAASQAAFGLATEGSRMRNQKRWNTITYAYNEFMGGTSVVKLEMTTELVTGGILSMAVAAPFATITKFHGMENAHKKFQPAWDRFKNDLYFLNNKKVERFTVLVENLSKSQALDSLKNQLKDMSPAQLKKLVNIIKDASGGAEAKITIKLINNKQNIRIITERPGSNGFQRFTHEICPEGKHVGIVQTAYDKFGDLVSQKPGQTKNNLYDLKFKRQ